MLKIKTGFFWLAWTLLFLIVPAHAYVDPGSGSVIVTTILGIFAAIGFTFRKWFYKLRKSIFGAKSAKEENRDDE
jgi:hypothetical protein